MVSNFTLDNYIFNFVFIILISFVINFPDLYSIYKNKKKWLPVNFPPYLNGDEYHYFSILNFLHRRFLNIFFGYNLSLPKIAAHSKFQIIGYMFNLPVYHIGFMIGDRRFGVLFVRIWNSICLGASFIFLFYVIAHYLKINTENLLLPMIGYMAYILIYPGILRVRSIILNINEKDYIYKHDDANDLFRAMFSATSAPIFLLSYALLIFSQTGNFTEANTQFLLIFLMVLLFFLYLPISFVFGCSLLLGNLINNNYVFFAVTLVFLILLIVFYFYKVSKDEVGKELFAHSDSGKIFVSDFRLILRIFIILLPCLIISYYLFFEKNIFLSFLTLLLGIFAFSFFLKKHQLSRFYDRGSCIVLQAIIIIVPIFQFENNKFNYIFFIILFGMILYYFLNQAINLYKNFSTTVENSIYKRINFLTIFDKNNKVSKVVVTNSPIISGLVDVFGSDDPLLRQYSIQSNGYKKNLENVCKNFILLNYSLDEQIEIFSKNIKKSEWIFKRPFKNSDSLFEDSMWYSIQYIISCFEYNGKIIEDKMYDQKKGWTINFKNLIKERYHKVKNENINSEIIIL